MDVILPEKILNKIVSLKYLCNNICKIVVEYINDYKFDMSDVLITQYFIDKINKLYIDCSGREGCKINIRYNCSHSLYAKPYVICNNSKHLKLYKCPIQSDYCLGIIKLEKVMYKYGIYMCRNCFTII